MVRRHEPRHPNVDAVRAARLGQIQFSNGQDDWCCAYPTEGLTACVLLAQEPCVRMNARKSRREIISSADVILLASPNQTPNYRTLTDAVPPLATTSRHLRC